MTAIQQALPPLLGGVSQQTDSQMSPSNVRSCTNFIPDLVSGLAKRPGSHYIRSLTGAVAEGSWFDVTLEEEEDYSIQIARDGTVRVWDALSGEVQTVSTQVTAYTAHQGRGDVEVLQVGDFVFILNRNVKVLSSTALPASASKVYQAWLELVSVDYESTYRVILTQGANVYTATYNTPASGVISVQSVLAGIRAAMGAAFPVTFAVEEIQGNVIGVRWVDFAANETNPFTLSGNGGLTGGAIRFYNAEVTSPGELPPQYFNARPVRIRSVGSQSEGYWVEFTPDAGSSWFGNGTWSETIKGRERFALDTNTMPHALVRRANGTWVVRALDGVSPLAATESVAGVATTASPTGTPVGRYYLGQTFHATGGTGQNLRLRVTDINPDGSPQTVSVIRGGFGFTAADVVAAENGDEFIVNTVATQSIANPSFANEAWAPRTVGDLTTVPFPSFVDNTITGIGFFLNRLVLFSGDNVITSKAGDPLNFFPTSAAQVLDDDPVDLNAGASARLVFRHAIPYNRQMMCVADDAIYSLRTRDEAFSPASAELSRSSKVSSSTIVPPLEKELSWVILDEGVSGVRVYELYPNADDDPNLSRPRQLNIQAPSYIPSGVFVTAVDTQEGLIGLVTEQEPNAIYVLRYKEEGRQQLLSAWCKFTVKPSIQHIYVRDNRLYIVGTFNGATTLSYIRLGITNPAGRLDLDGEYFDPCLDLMDFTLDVSYDEETDVTSIDVTGTIYDDEDNVPFLFILDGADIYTYLQPTYNAGLLEVPGPIGTTDAVIGYPYDAEALLPHIYLRSEAGGITADPPKVRRLDIRGFRSGAFEVLVEVPGRDPYTALCSTITPTNYLTNTLAMQRIASCPVGLMCDGDLADVTIIAPNPLPTNIQEITWKGTYSTKGLSSQ